MQLVEIEPFLRSHCTQAMFLHLSSARFAQIREELKFIGDGGICDGDGFEALKAHAVWKLVYTLSYLLYEQLHQKKSSNKNEDAVLFALEMIESEEHSKTEIALSCGFYDLSHMERAIKNM